MMQDGGNAYLASWGSRPGGFIKAFKEQFTAYVQRLYPFSLPLGPGQMALSWWTAFLGSENAGILAAVAVKVLSICPNSMADERTMSYITMLNTAQRSWQTVNTVVVNAQIRSFYSAELKKTNRVPAQARPLSRFFDIKRLQRGLDDDKSDEHDNYDDTDDEGELAASTDSPDTTASSSEAGSARAPRDSLPGDDSEDEFDLCLMTRDVHELLADAPIPVQAERTSKKSPEPISDNGSLELGDWA